MADRRINVGDEVYLKGYGTYGRVMAEQQQAGIRMLTVAWHVGGFHTAPEDGWLLVSQARETRMMMGLWAGVAILGGLVFLVTLAILT